MRPRPVSVLLCMLVVSYCVGCATGPGAERRFEYRQIIMGVEARITLFAPTEAHARDAARAAYDRMIALEAVMSDHRSDSELMRVCAAAGTGPVPISDDLVRVLARAREIGRASDGAFDVTVGPLVALWRDARRTGRLPSEADRRGARARAGRDLLLLDEHAGTLDLARPGMRLDLGGIGKGFAADEALVVLGAHATPRALVDLGGDVVAGAAPPGADGWRVTVETGLDDAAPRTITLARAAVATSGSAAQSVVIDGVRYAHIVDPRTGLGVTGDFAVTVVAPDGATADALASAASVLGRDRGAALAQRFGGAIVRSTNGRGP